MWGKGVRYFVVFFISASIAICAQSKEFSLTLQEAQEKAIEYSFNLKAARSDIDAASEQESAGKTMLFPKLSFQGTYSYLLSLPKVSLGGPNTPPVIFGDHNNYSLGPSFSYTLWDNFSSIKNYHSLMKIKESKEQMQAQTHVQILFAVQTAYTRVQLALEELKLVNGFLQLAIDQHKDVSNRGAEGSGSKLDEVVSKRQVLTHRLQYRQTQSALSIALADLFALIGNDEGLDISAPGPPGERNATLFLKIDTLKDALAKWGSKDIESPTSDQPQLRAQELMAQAAELAAASQWAKLFPKLDMQINFSLAYPNGPQLVNHFQNTIGLSFSVPLYLGDPTWHVVEQKKAESRSIRYRARQMKSDIDRDFEKATQMLKSLKAQHQLALDDMAQAKQVAQMYAESFKAGKTRLIDVQNANNGALAAKVNAARIDAQMLQQFITLMALTGKESSHD